MKKNKKANFIGVGGLSSRHQIRKLQENCALNSPLMVPIDMDDKSFHDSSWLSLLLKIIHMRWWFSVSGTFNVLNIKGVREYSVVKKMIAFAGLNLRGVSLVECLDSSDPISYEQLRADYPNLKIICPIDIIGVNKTNSEILDYLKEKQPDHVSGFLPTDLMTAIKSVLPEIGLSIRGGIHIDQHHYVISMVKRYGPLNVYADEEVRYKQIPHESYCWANQMQFVLNSNSILSRFAN